MKRLALLAGCLSLSIGLLTCGGNIYWGHWATDGPVYATLVHNNKLYLAGNFSVVRAYTGRGAMVNLTDGMLALKKKVPHINNIVWTAVPDGGGGWYIGGEFTQINGQARNRIARIKSDGSLHPWNPNASGTVYKIVKSGNTIYVGGSFQGIESIGGSDRDYIAAINEKTGQATTWNPGANSTVRTMALSDTTLYAGGSFTTIGGQSRNFIAALGTESNTATDWNPGANNPVYALAVSGSTVYVGGNFTSIGGQPRNRIAALDATVNTSNATDWNPNASATVYAVAVSGTTVYAGGDFNGVSSIGGADRNYIAALDATINTSNATAWNPGANGYVMSIQVAGATVYAGGAFSVIGTFGRSCAAALDATTGIATDWNPAMHSTVCTIAVTSKAVYLGGGFQYCNNRARTCLAAVDLATCALTGWNPGADNNVFALAAYDSTIYAGGVFTTIGGVTQANIAALDADGDGTPEKPYATTWTPVVDGYVESIVATKSVVYAGGTFSTIGGQVRFFIGAIDAATGLPTDWNPGADASVSALALSEDTLYAGGSFSNIGGQPRIGAAALDTTLDTNNATAFDPGATAGTVRCLAVTKNAIYAGGSFTAIGGQSRSNIAALDPATGNATAWDPGASNTVAALRVSGSLVYAGGAFNGSSSIGGADRNYIASLNAAGDGITMPYATDWDPNFDSGVSAISISGDNIIAGGIFVMVCNLAYYSYSLAGINADTALLHGW